MKITREDALIVVDVQKDFCPGGALAVENGDAVVPVINRLVPLFEHVVYTRDWHPEDHCSFAEGEPEFVDGSWPPHCVAETPGAAFHDDLTVVDEAIVVSKATQRDSEAYSGFQDTTLAADLRKAGVTRVVVAGLATDYCVKNTALDAMKAGFETVVVEDAVRGVDVPEGSAAEALEALREAGVRIVRSVGIS